LPVLTIINPSPICAPAIVDLTLSAITSGSTPAQTFTYFTNAANTATLATPTAVATAGTYYIKGTLPTGCSASQPVTVSILAQPTVIINNPAAVCAPAAIDLTLATVTAGSAPGLTYTYFTNAANTGMVSTPASVTTGGVYYIKATQASSGCSASLPVTVTINPLPVINITNPAAVCAPGTVNLTAATITAASTAGLTYSYWSNAATTSVLSIASSVGNSGTYYIKGTTAAGCSAAQPVTVSIHPQPTVLITNPAAICPPATVNLTADAITSGSNPGLTYSYFTNAANTNMLATPSAVGIAGTYYIKGTLPATGCSVSQPVTVSVNAQPVINITNPPAVCEPATVDLTASTIVNGSTAGLTYTYWTDAANTSNVPNPTSVSTSGTYYIKGALATGCSASLPVTVAVTPLPTGTLQNPPVNFICEGTPLLLTTISNANRYQWYADQKIIQGATAADHNAVSAGEYTVQFISMEGCVKEAGNSIRLDLVTKPLLQFKADSSCAGLVTNFRNQSSFASSGGISWLWDFGDGSSSNTFSAAHAYRGAGTYPVSLTANTASCPGLTNKITIPVIIESPQAGTRYATVNAVAGQTFVLNARPIGVSYQWKPPAGLSNATVPSPTGILSKDTTYTVAITSPAGCITTDTVLVKVATLGEVYVPQGFTPNGDGRNDRLYPNLVAIQKLNYFKVFNRWGNIVFETNDATPQNGWNGKYSGVLQPAGAYSWIAEGVDATGVVIRRSGTVLLIN